MNIFITGASSGIGKALAYDLSKRGHKLFLASRNTEKLEAISKDINRHSPNSIYFSKCDVTIKSDIEHAVKNANNSMGSVDIAVLNSGVGGKYFFKQPVESDFRNVMDTNFYSVLHCMEYLVPLMINQGQGHISVVSSMADVRGFENSAPYGASKAALSLAMESARAELAPLGITVSTIRPGFVKSSITDKNKFKMPFLMETERAAKIIATNILKNKKHIYFPWQMRLISNLIRCLPDSLYDKLSKSLRG